MNWQSQQNFNQRVSDFIEQVRVEVDANKDDSPQPGTSTGITRRRVVDHNRATEVSQAERLRNAERQAQELVLESKRFQTAAEKPRGKFLDDTLPAHFQGGPGLVTLGASSRG